MQKPKKYIVFEYLKRLFTQTWFLITGSIWFVVALIFDIFSKTTNLKIYYGLLIVLSLLVASFLVFREIFMEYEKLKNQLNEIDNSQPIIDIYFKNNNENLSNEKRIDLILNPILQKPNILEIVNSKRKTLLSKQFVSNNYQGVRLGLRLENPNYEQEVEDFISEYQKYLEKMYECLLDRAYEIGLVIHNKGQIPGNNVTIDICMPNGYLIPEDHQRFNRKINKDNFDDYLEEPVEPEPYIDRYSLNLPNLRFQTGFDEINNSSALVKFRGPKYETRNSEIHVIYTIDKLIQHTPLMDLDPFWIWLGIIEKEQIWELKTKITCAEFKNPVEQVLFINIGKP